jgi:hypothetical protein
MPKIIYTTVNVMKKPFLFDFLTEPKNATEIEKYIMIKNGDLDKFNMT